MIASELTVILTATVRTDVDVVRKDPAVRLADYRRGLRFWLGLPDPRVRRIIFLENSSSPLASLESEARAYNPYGRDCEFISLDCNVLLPNLHYGYTEFQMIDLGLQRSRLYGISPMLVKATGRYEFPGISRLLDRLPGHCSFAADSRDSARLRRANRQITNCALLVFSKDFYDRHVRMIYREMRPAPPWTREQFMEPMLFDRLLPFRERPDVVLRWPVNCDPSGMGANNDSYDSTLKRLFRCARAISRVVAPRWWI